MNRYTVYDDTRMLGAGYQNNASKNTNSQQLGIYNLTLRKFGFYATYIVCKRTYIFLFN